MTIKTIRCCLCGDETTRKFFWEAMVSYTLLVNHLLAEVANHSQFQEWQSKGDIPRQPIEKLIEEFTADMSAALPCRFRTSAVLMTQYVYKAWFKQQQKRRWRLQGKKQWVEVIESDNELAQTTSFSQEEVCSRAREILDLVNSRGIGSLGNQSRDKPKARVTLLGFLLDRFEGTHNLLERRAIVHLLKNNLTVNEQDKDLKSLAQQLESKKIEIERLERQLESRLPKGRDPNGESYLESLLAAIALPDSVEIGHTDANVAILKEQKQIEPYNSLPYPIIFGSADDLIWSVEVHNSAPHELEFILKQKIATAKNRKKKNSSDRLCVRFKGLRNAMFKVQCDRRQLPISRQFLTDYEFHFQTPEKERFSQGLFILKSAQLLWCPNTQKHHHKPVSEQTQSSGGNPWETHRLYLHCNIDTRLQTAEGTEEVRQQKRQETLKSLKGQEALSEQQLQELELSATQRSHVKRLRTTLSRLENSAPHRPSTSRYQGNPLIVVGVSLNPQTLLTACVVDLQTGSILNTQNAKQLLTVKNVKVKRGKRSTLQLKLADWRLINKLHLQRQRNLTKRPEEYKQGQYRENASESSLGLYVERLLASRLVNFALKSQASTIVIPDLKHIREILESDIQARARRRYPAQKELQEGFAKQLRITIHRWSYSRLIQCIRERAARKGIAVITGQQPLQGEPQQKAKQVAIAILFGL
jgi:IS605 OrfB family transposase